jgi:hypothetical protein
MKLSETALVIENLQENLEFTRGKHQGLLKSDLKKFDVQTDLIYNKAYDSMESMRKILMILLNRIVGLFRDQIRDK